MSLNFCNISTTYINLFVWHFLLTARQPVMQELKVFLNEAKEQWKDESAKIDSKMDALIELEKEKLALEREKLEFKKLLFQQKNKGINFSVT